MASNLFNMLADLAADSEKLDQFRNDSVGTMQSYGLTEDQIDKLTSGQEDDFHEVMEDEARGIMGLGEGDRFVC